MASILIVEDEKPINDLIEMNLKLVGHNCDQAYEGKTAKEKIKCGLYDLIIMDIMLPDYSGLQLMKFVKKTPVLFVTARNNITDKIEAFSIGAEDYLVKPFEILELVARVNVILRRNKDKEHIIQIGKVQVDLDGRNVYDEKGLVELTPQEFDLLEVLIVNRNLALSREKLLELAWDISYAGDTRTVDVHIQKLRKKLGFEDKIVTVYKHGYRLEIH